MLNRSVACAFYTVVISTILTLFPASVLAGQVSLRWELNSEPDINGYYIYFGTQTGNYDAPNSPLFIVHPQNIITVTGLQSGQEYFFTLTAVDQSGNVSLPGYEISTVIPGLPDTTPPSTPAMQSAVADSSTQATITWSAATDNIAVTGYTLYRDNSPLTTTSNLTFIDTTLSPSTTYAYSVVAHDAADNNSDPSAEATITTEPPGDITVLDVRVAAGSDDAEEHTTGAVNMNSSDLELVLASTNQTVGMRFAGLTIPQGATIVNAWVQFQVDEVSTDTTTLTIEGEATDQAESFGDATGNISTRSRTAASVNWSPAPWSSVGVAGPDQQTPNLAAIMQELVNRGGWTSGNAVALLITGTGKRVAESYNGHSSAAPLLHVEYQIGDTSPTDTTPPSTPEIQSAVADSSTQATITWTPATDNVGVTGYTLYRDNNPVTTTPNLTFTDTNLSPSSTYSYAVVAHDGAANDSAPSTEATVTTKGPEEITILDVRVAAGSDDAEEHTTGAVNMNSSDLELVLASTNQTVGMRFAGLTIPQGATIVNAWVQFQVDEVSTDTTTLTIEGEATDQAESFGDATGNISTRSRTAASVNWSPAPWSSVGVAGPDQQTPNLAAIMQELVNRGGWTSGNAVALLITGTGKRVAESYNGHSSAAPLLHVEYQIGDTSPTDTTPPSTPEIQSAVADSSTQATVTWSAATDGVAVTGYTLYRDNYPLTTTSNLTFIDTTLSPSTTYAYFVVAHDDAGNNSGQSTNTSITTPAPPDTTPPSTPVIQSAVADSSTQATITWSAATDNVAVTGYTLYRDNNPLTTTSNPKFIDTTLSSSTTYAYSVVAHDAMNNTSAPSAPMSVTSGGGGHRWWRGRPQTKIPKGPGRIPGGTSGVFEYYSTEPPLPPQDLTSS